MTFPSDAVTSFVTEDDYRAFSEENSRAIEIVHGTVIRCESPSPRHNQVAFRLAMALDRAKPSHPCYTVLPDLDVILWRVPLFTFRRPDVVVYRCIDDPTRKPEASEVVLVVEVTSPTTTRIDLIDKKAQYAAAAIPQYLVIRLDDDGEIIDAIDYHLDAASGQYEERGREQAAVRLKFPFPTFIAFDELLGIVPSRLP